MHDPMVLVFSIRRPWPRVRMMKKRHPRTTGAWFGAQPWWRKALHWVSRSHWRIGRVELYWPSIIDVWHIEPGGRDALEVCRQRITVDQYLASWRLRLDPRVKHRSVTQAAADEAALGYREWIVDNRWRWHLHHWSVRFIPWRTFSRWARSRCAHCGRRFRWGEAPTSHSWYGIAADCHVVNRLLGWEFDHDKATGSGDVYELVHTHAEHVARYDR